MSAPRGRGSRERERERVAVAIALSESWNDPWVGGPGTKFPRLP